MSFELSRRQWLAGLGMSAGAAWATTPQLTAAEPTKNPIRYCLNTATIRGQKLPITETVDLVAKAGYQGIEPWMNELQDYVKAGGNLSDLRKRIADAGLQVESAIGFAEWIVDDADRRAKGLETAKRDMDLVRQIGGTRIAAPPAGATKQADLSLTEAGKRYHALLEAGKEIGVIPQLEVWGFSACLSRLSETLFVAAEAGHPNACILPDIYHLYKGGTSFDALPLLASGAVHVFHMNDYPAQPPRAEINDAARVHCGDGVAPLTDVLRGLFARGYRGVLSLELFNPTYYKQEPAAVLKEGLEKMQKAVALAS